MIKEYYYYIKGPSKTRERSDNLREKYVDVKAWKKLSNREVIRYYGKRKK
jgi:hypothetical protein